MAAHYPGVRSSVNNLTASLLGAVVVLAPLPFGSNRPFFWTVWAVVVALIALWHCFSTWRHSIELPYPLVRLWPQALAFSVVLAFLLLQLAPLGEVLRSVGLLAASPIETPSISLAPGATWLMLLRFATFGLMFFLCLQVGVNRHRAYLMLQVMFFAVAAYAVYGILALTQLGDTILGLPKEAYLGSATGPFVNRNSFAMFLGFGLVTGLCVLLSEFDTRMAGAAPQSRPLRLGLAALGLVFILAALYASQSRMGLFSGLAGCFFVVVLAGARSGARGWPVALAAVAALGLGTALFFIFGGGLYDRFSTVEASAESRLALYQQVIGMITARPWVGYGGGAFEIAFPLFHELPVSPDKLWDRAHSTYLALWTELGIVVGSLPILAIIAIAWRVAAHYWRSPSYRGISLATLGVIVVAALNSVIDFGLEMEANALFFTAVLGLGLAGVGGSAKALATAERPQARARLPVAPLVPEQSRE
jgi:O-antigen ligase